MQTIERVALRIKELCPGARVEIGHGQMDEDDLEEVMQRFVDGKTDVLVSTTIIESGLDIPNANTIIIDRADRFGLADLYQFRGRVGRAQMKAYAYLMLPREMMTVGAARKRINAIKQYSTLGAGFKIAMRDLEIRGAGNVLGTAQSGHIVAIGFDLYCQLLKQAVSRLKGEKTKPQSRSAGRGSTSSLPMKPSISRRARRGNRRIPSRRLHQRAEDAEFRLTGRWRRWRRRSNSTKCGSHGGTVWSAAGGGGEFADAHRKSSWRPPRGRSQRSK